MGGGERAWSKYTWSRGGGGGVTIREKFEAVVQIACECFKVSLSPIFMYSLLTRFLETTYRHQSIDLYST